MCNVVIESRGHNKVLHYQVSVQSPNELLGPASVRVGFPEASIGALDEGMVLFDCFRDARHFEV
jgi:hypothetical protein